MSTRPFLLASPLALAVTLALSGMAQAQVSGPSGADEARPAATLQEAAAAAGERAAQTLSTPQPPTAPEKAKLPVTGGANFDLMSHYVWRGFVLTDSFSFQPTVWGKVGDLMVSSWSSWAEGQDGGPLMEHDLTVDYTKAVGKVTYSVGYINYLFPAVDEGSVSNEIYGGTAFAVPLNPTVKVYFDFHEGHRHLSQLRRQPADPPGLQIDDDAGLRHRLQPRAVD